MQEYTSCHWIQHGLSFENDHIEMCCLCCHKGGGRLYIKDKYNGKGLNWDDIFKLKQKFKENKLVKDTFYVLRPAVIGMLGVSLAAMITPLVYISGAATFLAGINYKAIILFVLLLIGILKFKKLHPIVFIGIGAAVGIIFKF